MYHPLKQMYHPWSHFLFTCLLLFSTKATFSHGGENTDATHNFSIGAIIDYSSRQGKEEMTAMYVAVQDYYKYTGHKPVLHIRNSAQDPVNTTFAAIDLVNKKKVGAILCFRMCEQVALAAELGDAAHVPIISFADTTTSFGSAKRWPFLIQAKHNQYKQMRAVAAITGTWQWRRVNVIYEDVSSVTSTIFPHLIDALKQVESKIDHFVPLQPLDISQSLEKLEKLKGEQTRVFIVHTSLPLANHLFKEAKKMGLMEKNSVWIITSSITDHLDVANSSVIYTMQGILGVKTYFPRTGAQFKNFNSRFQDSFHLEHPKEGSMEPGVVALQAYDAVWLVALSMEGRQNEKKIGESAAKVELGSPLHGERLLEKILSSSFVGLTGEFRFTEGELAPAHSFRIVNVVGRSYRELGYYSDGEGFSKSLEGRKNMSMKILGQLVWPGGPWSVPRGWTVPTSERELIIGVPNNPVYDRFTNVRYDLEGKPIFSGISIAVFKAMLGYLPYDLPYVFVPYNGTYNSLVEQVYNKMFDAAVGDIAILAKRNELAEFSHPWSESGIQMIVYKNPVESNRAWLFFKPFTNAMWALTAAITIYNGFIIWLMERTRNPVLNGSVSDSVGELIWLSFTTLFCLHGERLHTNLSRITMVMWLFVAIIIIQSYTASLTTMLTIPHIEQKEITVEFLKTSNAKVGCDGKSFVVNYLETALGFKSQNIKKYYNKDDYSQALKTGEISAAFLEVPYVRFFMAKYCKNFAVTGETYKVGGFGFAFPKGSSMLPDISQAVLQVEESGEFRELENALLKSYNCTDSDDNLYSLGVTSFWGLFLMTGGTSTISLVVYLIRTMRSRFNDSIPVTFVYNGEHDPAVDEEYMFAPEIRSISRTREIDQEQQHNNHED